MAQPMPKEADATRHEASAEKSPPEIIQGTHDTVHGRLVAGLCVPDDQYRLSILILYGLFAILCSCIWYYTSLIERAIDVNDKVYSNWLEASFSERMVVKRSVYLYNHGVDIRYRDLKLGDSYTNTLVQMDYEIEIEFTCKASSAESHPRLGLVLPPSQVDQQEIIHLYIIDTRNTKEDAKVQGPLYISEAHPRCLFYHVKSGILDSDLELLNALESLLFLAIEPSEGRMLHYHPGYQITFDLLVPDPSHTLRTWEIQPAIHDYFGPFLRSISHLSDFHIKSQVLRYTELNIIPKHCTNSTDANGSSVFEYYYIDQDALPHFVNAGQWQLESSIACLNPPIHFMTYIAPPRESPLYIKQRDDADGALYSAFLLPQSGGVYIYNSPFHTFEATLTKKDLKPVMETFMSQFRELLGLLPTPQLSCSMLDRNFIGVTAFEENAMTTFWCTRNLRLVRDSMRAILDMFKKLPSLPINKDVSKKVTSLAIHTISYPRLYSGLVKVLTSMDYYGQSVEKLKHGQVRQAYLTSKAAFREMEAAFFDSTMISQLYFPETNKLGVYIPLLLPIWLPVVFSLLKLALQTRRPSASR